MSTEQRENLEAALRRSAIPVGTSVSEQRRLLRERASSRLAPADVTVTPAELGGVPAASITIDGIEPRHVVLYLHGGVYVLGDAFQSADLAAQIGRRVQARVISLGYRLAPEHPYPAAVDDVPHVFQNFYPILDEAAAALDRAGQFLTTHIARAADATA